MATPDFIAALRSVLARHDQVRLAILFGSFGQGTARAHSDVDLGVLLSQPLTVEQRMTLIGDIAEVTGRAVDLVDLRTAGEPLMGQILVHGRRLSGSDEDYATLLSRHLIDSTDFMPYVQRMLAERRQAWIGK